MTHTDTLKLFYSLSLLLLVMLRLSEAYHDKIDNSQRVMMKTSMELYHVKNKKHVVNLIIKYITSTECQLQIVHLI